MKKILLSVFIVFILFGVTGCGKEEEEEQEPTTLTEYFESLKKDVSPYEFKCSVLENNNIIYLDYAYSGSKIFLSNGQVYDAVIGDKTFSNGEQCKQNINYPTVKKVVPFSYEKYFLTTSNDVCKYSKSYSTTSGSQEDDKIECDLLNSEIAATKRNAVLIKDGNVNSILATSYYSEYKNKKYNYYYVYYHFNSDNKIYKTTMNDKAKIISTTEISSVPNYGNIKQLNATVDTNNNTVSITKLSSDLGYYELKDIVTEECSKYVDIECEKKFMMDEILEKYWSSIKYVSDNYIFTKDNHVYTFYALSTLKK